jgi:hypothetical protein
VHLISDPLYLDYRASRTQRPDGRHGFFTSVLAQQRPRTNGNDDERILEGRSRAVRSTQLWDGIRASDGDLLSALRNAAGADPLRPPW